MRTELQITPWPALLTQEAACAYLSIAPDRFRALVNLWNIDPVLLAPDTIRWRLSDLEKLTRRLPSTKAPSVPGDSVLRLDAKTVNAIVEQLAQRLATLGSPPNIGAPRLVSIKEACGLLGLGRSTIYRLISNGALQARKIGKRTLISQDSISGLITPAAARAKS